MIKEEKLYCDRCGKEIKHYFYISDIDNKYLCKNCSDAENPKELARQLAELKADNEKLLNENGYLIFADGYDENDKPVHKQIYTTYKEKNKELVAENKKLRQQLKEKDEEIEQYQKLINDICNKFYAGSLNDLPQKITHQVCEKIRKLAHGLWYFVLEEQKEHFEGNRYVLSQKDFNDILDQIEGECNQNTVKRSVRN